MGHLEICAQFEDVCFFEIKIYETCAYLWYCFFLNRGAFYLGVSNRVFAAKSLYRQLYLAYSQLFQHKHISLPQKREHLRLENKLSVSEVVFIEMFCCI